MIYGCGLRISEAVNLTVSDVNLSEGTIFIKDTKFGKERLIPMADTLKTMQGIQYSCSYRKIRHIILFHHHLEDTIKVIQFMVFFVKFYGLQVYLIPEKDQGLHDMRHTYAVHCLKKWALANRDMTNCMPYLSAYLGHEDLRGSQRYLPTADLYPDITSKVEKNCSWLIPEVNWHETYLLCKDIDTIFVRVSSGPKKCKSKYNTFLQRCF